MISPSNWFSSSFFFFFYFQETKNLPAPTRKQFPFLLLPPLTQFQASLSQLQVAIEWLPSPSLMDKKKSFLITIGTRQSRHFLRWFYFQCNHWSVDTRVCEVLPSLPWAPLSLWVVARVKCRSGNCLRRISTISVWLCHFSSAFWEITFGFSLLKPPLVTELYKKSCGEFWEKTGVGENDLENLDRVEKKEGRNGKLGSGSEVSQSQCHLTLDSSRSHSHVGLYWV